MTGIFSAYLLVGWLVGRRLPPRPRGALLVALAPAAFWGPGGVPLLGYVRAVVGDLAVPTLFLLGTGILGLGRRVERTRAPLLACAAVAAPLFYPPALGACRFQPYAWGFGAPLFLLGLLALSALLWFRGRRGAAAVLLAAPFAWQLGTGESSNLWDYLLDPLLASAALFAALRRAVRPAPSPAPPPLRDPSS